MPDLLLYGDTDRNSALRHEVPIAILDPFLYAEVGGEPHIMCHALERERLAAAVPGARLTDVAELGFYELLESGSSRDELFLELLSRAVDRFGVREAIVDFDFPLGVAERLRADGVALTVDDETIKRRRRVKSDAELDGIRRAQKAAEAGMAAAAASLKAAAPVDGTLHVNGGPLTAEAVREAMRNACWEQGALLGPETIVASVWQGYGHEPGSGPLPANLPIEVDLWPRDEASGCWADMTRTFVVGGEPPDQVLRQEQLVIEAIETARRAIKPGVTGRELHALSCDVFEREGYRTQRTGPGEDPNEGFQFSLGHGVGLMVHEDPALGQTGHDALVAGDVLAIEPGLWQRDVGGVRFEDLVLVTESGSETLTNYPYGLAP
jgi:Xaa-Pro aminopeptidase